MDPSDLARLDALRAAARPLEPAPAERDAATTEVLARARAVLAHDPPPAYATAPGARAALAALPIRERAAPDAFGRALDYLDAHVANHGHTAWAPGFFGYIPGGNLHLAALADYHAAVMNPFTGHIVASPGGIPLEHQVITWLAGVVGFPATSAGNLSSGGSLANLGAILAARQAARLRARDVERAVAYLTDHVHHCVTKGLRVAGLEDCVLRRVPMDGRWRMRADALDDVIRADRDAGLMPWLVVVSAGTTDTGAVDPLGDVAGIAAEHGLWCHIDAAYGGMFALCAPGRAALAGIERSDSVVLDPHKGMFLPYGVGAVLVKDSGAMLAANAFEAHYVPDAARDPSESSPMEHSAELSRPFRGLRLWLPLQALGSAPFAAALEEKLLLARYAWDTLAAIDRIEVGPAPELSVFAFRALPRDGDTNPAATDRLNEAIEAAFLADGRVLFSSTRLGGRRWLRFAVLALTTHREAIDLAARLLADMLRKLAP